MNKQSGFKNLLSIFFQGLGAALAFVLSMIVSNLLVPLSPEIMAAQASASGFLSIPLAWLFNASVNALILVWVARRSSFKGLALIGQLFVLSFGAQVFMAQIETAYFISAFPLLNNNFQLYILILRGFITSLLFSLLVTWIVGGFSRNPRPQTAFSTTSDIAVRHGSWLSVVYIALYLLFGYFVAWRVQEVRLFYGGPAELNGPLQQWALTLMTKPEFPAFQYFRGVMWMLCLVPLFMGFSGKRIELVILSALALALLPTAALAFANPLMPASVSLAHFWEVSISTGIFGVLCAWFVPKRMSVARPLEGPNP